MNPGVFIVSQPLDEAVILGAGFSKAIHDAMPIADELGRRAAERAGIDDHPAFVDGRFELWLSRLAEYQPDLSEADNALNAARFAQLADAIHEELLEAQNSFDGSVWPKWLLRLISAWHHRKTSVITFNYDTLVEWATESSQLWDFRFFPLGQPRDSQLAPIGERIGWHSLIGGVPPLAGPKGMKDPLPRSFRLLKMHGSLNWYWSRGDQTGSTLQSWDLLPGDDEERRRRYLPGRDPFVVPPTAAKSRYFDNPIVREIWRRSHEALDAATTIHLVGYSLPLADVLSTSMIAETLESTDLVVVNPRFQEVSERLERMSDVQPKVYESVEDWADDLVMDTSRRVIQLVAESSIVDPETTLVSVGWDWEHRAYVGELIELGDTLVVDATDTDSQAQPQMESIVNYRELATAARGKSRLLARLRDRQESPIVGIDGFGQAAGPSQRHQILIPADPAAPVAGP